MASLHAGMSAFRAGRYSEAVDALVPWMQAANVDDPERGGVGLAIAFALARLDRREEGRAQAERTLTESIEHDWPATEARAMLFLTPYADGAWAATASRAVELGDTEVHAAALALRAERATRTGDAEEAAALLSQVLPMLESLSQQTEVVARAWWSIGIAYGFVNRLAEAEAAFERSCEIADAIGYVGGQSQARGFLGLAVRTRGDGERGLQLQREAVALAETTEDQTLLGWELHRLTDTLLFLGRDAEAQRVRERAEAIISTIWSTVREGNQLLQRGQWLEAMQALQGQRGPDGVVELCRLLGCLPGRMVQGDMAVWDDTLARAESLRTTCPPDQYVANLARMAAEVAEQYARDSPARLGRAMLAWRMVAAVCRASGRTEDLENAHTQLLRLRGLGAMVPVGRFLLDQPLGAGAVGRVWRATGPGGAAVAVKILAPGIRPRLASQLSDEIAATAALDHRNIVRILDHGRIDEETAATLAGRVSVGAPWLALELAELGTLEPWCAAMAWPTLRSVLLALLDALAHAHARGVLHLDIKPANVLISGTVERPIPKLADLGLSGLHAHVGRVAGTPAFMAPEQLTGRTRDLGPWTDLYALGCLTTMLVQGRPPFDQEALADVRAAHLGSAVPPLEPAVPVPAGLQSWLARALAKSPRDRFRRAADAARALMQLGPARGPTRPGAPVVPTRTSELPTIVLPELDSAIDDGPAPEGACAVPAPEVPLRWQHRTMPRRPDLVGSSLGLFGLRAVPIVGRLAERSLLWACLRDVSSTRTVRAAVIHGPPGCGSRRLAAWTCERAHEVGAARVLQGRTLSELVDGAYQLEGLDASHLLPRLVRLLGDEAAPDVTGEAAALIGLRAGTLDVRSSIRLVARMLGRAGRQRPTVVHLDRPDDAGVQLVTRLLGTEVPALFVVTPGSDAAFDRLADLDGVVPIGVGPLPSADQEALLEAMLPLDPELRAELAAVSAASPEHGVQLLTELIDRSQLVAGPSGHTRRTWDTEPLSADLQTLWRGRIRRVRATLGTDERVAIQRALTGDRSAVEAGTLDKLRRVRAVVATSDGWAFASDDVVQAFSDG